ncbi:MAG: hypothetical protein Q7N87_00020 [Candidatus Uhrbacteria bacterium]|nr:hypothetical protein [Candidatus Uhrbacteria bacterium]
MEDPFGGKKKPTGTELVRSGPGTTALNRPAPGTGLAAPRRDKYAMVAQEPRRVDEKRVVKRKRRYCIVLDATSSMAQLIEQAKRHIAAILLQAMADGGEVEVMIIVYRDYGDRPLTEHSECTSDSKALLAWLGGIRTHGGGGNGGEAVEEGLKVAKEFGPWTAIFLAGDEPAHTVETRGRGRELAPDYAREFGKMEPRQPIFTFVVPVSGEHCDPRTEASFKEIAELSGGICGKLDGGEAMLHNVGIAMAIAGKSAKEAGVGLARYMNAHAGKLSAGSAAFAAKAAGLLTAGGQISKK